MTQNEQVVEVSSMIESIVRTWCPSGCRHEPLEQQMARALLVMSACVRDQRLVIEGKTPIMGLDFYPQD